MKSKLAASAALYLTLGAAAVPFIAIRTASAKPVTMGAPRSFAAKPAPGTRARCAVTGDEFTVNTRTQTSTYNGRVYAFCCPDCKPDFDKEPAKFEDKSVKK